MAAQHTGVLYALVREEEGPAELTVSLDRSELVLRRLSRGDALFERQLAGTLERWRARFAGTIDAHAAALLLRLARTKHLWTVTGTPNLDNAPAREWLFGFAHKTHALLAVDQGLFDGWGRAVASDDRTMDPAAVLWSSESAMVRKQRSEEKLKRLGLPVRRMFPPLDGDDEAAPRPAQEIARRAQALWVLVLRSEGMERSVAHGLLAEAAAQDALLETEREFLEAVEPSKAQRNDQSWQCEKLAVLLWALGYLQALEPPSAVCNPARLSEILSNVPVAEFIGGARTRAIPELLDESDFHLRLFACAPAAQNPGVVYERDQVFRWLLQEPAVPWSHSGR